MKQQVRIIGGTLRGKKIAFPAANDLRPTPDRVRETVFNWLMHDIRGAICLDAFAGSGALGIEAFSRGAQQVTLIEQNRVVYDNLAAVCRSLHSPALQVIHDDSLRFLATSPQQFDLVFLDPPFTKNLYSTCLQWLENRDILKPGGLLYIESSAPLELNLKVWRELKLKQAGGVSYGLYEKGALP